MIAIIILMASSTILAAEPLRNLIFDKNKADKGLQAAEYNHYVDTREKTVEDKGIKLIVRGGLSDGIRTVIRVDAEGKGISKGKAVQYSDVVLINSRGTEYMQKELGLGVKTSQFGALSFENVETSEGEEVFTLKVGAINDIAGNWEVTFPMKVFKDSVYELNNEYVYGNQKIIISDLRISASLIRVNIKWYHNNESIPVKHFNLLINDESNFGFRWESVRKSNYVEYAIDFNAAEETINFIDDKVSLQLYEELDKRLGTLVIN